MGSPRRSLRQRRGRDVLRHPQDGTLRPDRVGTATRQGSSVFEYIEGFYNPRRRHSTLGYLSPLRFEEQSIEQQKESERRLLPKPQVSTETGQPQGCGGGRVGRGKATASPPPPGVGSLKCPDVTAQRELLVHTGTRDDVCPGLGWPSAPGSPHRLGNAGRHSVPKWMGSGVADIEEADSRLGRGRRPRRRSHRADIHPRCGYRRQVGDALWFERRQYEALIDRELNEIQQDVERGDRPSIAR